MLRINHSYAEALHRWTLCGQLAGPWVDELRQSWERTCADAPSTRQVLDLSDVTFIDESGEQLLSAMRDQGVEFVAAGVDTKHLLENLAARGQRSLRKLLGGAEGRRHWRCE